MRLIDANEIPWCNYDLDNYHSFVGVDKEYVDEMPTIEAVPVRHGRVVTSTDRWHTMHQNCSECGEELGWKAHPNYCSNCGAKLDVTDINVGNKDGGAE